MRCVRVAVVANEVIDRYDGTVGESEYLLSLLGKSFS